MGLVAATAAIAALLGVWLWIGLLSGPIRLVTGLLGASSHLTQAENKLAAGKIQAAGYRTLEAASAAADARSGYSSPLIDVARGVPGAAGMVEEAGHFVAAATYSSEAATGILDVAQNSLSGPDRIIRDDPSNPGSSIVDIDRVKEITGTVTEVRTAVQLAARELRAVDLDELPARARSPVLEGIENARAAAKRLTEAARGLRQLPGILGADGPRTYMLGIQNSAELRGTGGSILQFSLLTLDRGEMAIRGRRDKASATVYELDRNRTPLDIPLPPDAWYVRGVLDAQRFGNANWSPDWPLSAQLMLAYARASDERLESVDLPQIDGFIVVDPLGAQEIMPGGGPFTTRFGNYITSERFVFFVLYRAYGSYPLPWERRAALSQVSDGLFAGITSPKSPTKLVSGMGEALSRKHIQIWMADRGEQRFVQSMKWDGGIAGARGADYVNVVEQNVGGNKLDFFTTNENHLRISFAGDAAHVAARMSVRNDVFLPQPRWVLADSKSVHRPMMNLYVPKGAVLEKAAVKGGELIGSPPGLAEWTNGRPPEHFERGKKVWSATLQIPPETNASIRYDYRVPGVVQTHGRRKVYRLVVQHQPRVHPETLAIDIRVPDDAAAIKARGFTRRGRSLVWNGPLVKDMTLEVSWRS